MKIRTGDTVMVRVGKEKGKTGKVLSVQPSNSTVIVEGINIVKKHRKPSQTNNTGAIEEKNMPINVSKIGLVHPTKKSQTSRVGYKIVDGKKQRIYKANGKAVK
jgi:large subunit ribosomal protein L24